MTHWTSKDSYKAPSATEIPKKNCHGMAVLDYAQYIFRAEEHSLKLPLTIYVSYSIEKQISHSLVF